MLNKDEIIIKLKNEEFIVRNAIYEYICNCHLYDDKQINEAFIEFLENDYDKMDFSCLKYSKLNKDIVECLINISLSLKETSNIKRKISHILILHYNLIKYMDYNFEEILCDEDYVVYKKVKHFEKKEPSELIKLYKNNINVYYFSEDEEDVTEMLRTAMGIALVQTEDGYKELKAYIAKIIEEEGEEELIDYHMPYLIHPLHRYSDFSDYKVLLTACFTGMGFYSYEYECYSYFSNICNEKFVNYYISEVRKFNKKEIKDDYYAISEYLNSEKIDKFLFVELKRNKNEKIQRCIIRILLCRWNKDIIPSALEYLKKNILSDEYVIKKAIAPLLVVEKYDDKNSIKIIEEMKNFDEIQNMKYEMMMDHLKHMQSLILKGKQHIKDYKKARKIQTEIVDSMLKYLDQGKFDIDNDIENINCKIDTSTEIGMQAMVNALVYKNADNISCITEEYIKNKKYRSQEKIDMLKSMLNSEAGLFEITKAEYEEGKVYLRNVLNNKEYCIIDFELSCNVIYGQIYVYTRVITYHDISFGTGFNFAFFKDDKFICKWIKRNLKEIDKKQEITRFIELYREYMKNDNKIMIRRRYWR